MQPKITIHNPQPATKPGSPASVLGSLGWKLPAHEQAARRRRAAALKLPSIPPRSRKAAAPPVVAPLFLPGWRSIAAYGPFC